MFHCKFVFKDTDNLIVGMYSLDTVVQHTINVFCRKSSTRCEKIGLLSKLTVILHGG